MKRVMFPIYDKSFFATEMTAMSRNTDEGTDEGGAGGGGRSKARKKRRGADAKEGQGDDEAEEDTGEEEEEEEEVEEDDDDDDDDYEENTTSNKGRKRKGGKGKAKGGKKNKKPEPKRKKKSSKVVATGADLWGSKAARSFRACVGSLTDRLCAVLDRFSEMVVEVSLQDRTLLFLGSVLVSSLHVDCVKDGADHINCVQLGAISVVQVRRGNAAHRFKTSIVMFAPHAAAVDDMAVPPVPLFLCVEPSDFLSLSINENSLLARIIIGGSVCESNINIARAMPALPCPFLLSFSACSVNTSSTGK